MKFLSPLIFGKFIKRYKRFFADVSIGEDLPQIVVAHNANTGSMKNCLGPGWKAALSFHDSEKRKLKYTLEMLHNGETWIGLNTMKTNSIAIEGIKNGTIKELQGYSTIKPEIKIGNSRIDILLTNDLNEQCYVEVKSVTYTIGKNAYFPDSVSTRGQKHLRELMALKGQGIRSVLLFIVQREDCDDFIIENPVDPEYSALLLEAIDCGVEALVYQCKLSVTEIILNRKLNINKKAH